MQETELRRIERDLHDGAQARLVALGMSLGMAEEKLHTDPDGALALLAEARTGAKEALEELRDLARGIHPPILTDRGLEAAIAALAARSPVPVTLSVDVRPASACGRRDRRLLRRRRGARERDQARARDAHRDPDPARERHCSSSEVADDGRGGADPAGGGLTGLRQRVGALDGTLRVESPAGGPTTVQRGAAVRVVIAEDLALLRDGLTRLLRDNGFEVVAAVEDADALLRVIATEKPDIAIVDIRLPPTFRDEGVRAAIEARRRAPDTAILVVSQYVEQTYATELLADGRGGVGYLLKDRIMDVAEFVDAVRRVAEGGTALDPEVVAQLFSRRRHGPLERLTPRELEVLGLMAEGRSNAGIAEALVLTVGAVEKHIASILGKLQPAAVGERPPARARRPHVPPGRASGRRGLTSDKRATGLEPATSSLEGWRSTN